MKPIKYCEVVSPYSLMSSVTYHGKEAIVWGIQHGACDSRDAGYIYTLRIQCRYPYYVQVKHDVLEREQERKRVYVSEIMGDAVNESSDTSQAEYSTSPASMGMREQAVDASTREAAKGLAELAESQPSPTYADSDKSEGSMGKSISIGTPYQFDENLGGYICQPLQLVVDRGQA